MMRRVTSFARDDQGIALVVVMGAIALVTIFAMGGYAMANQAMHSTGRLQGEEAAFQVANSGMERELATFTESNFSSGQTTYQHAGSTPDGSYVVQVGFDPAVPYRYSLISSGTAGSERATVRQDFYFFDLWSTNIASKNNPDMGPMGSASAWNGNSTVSGPFYVGGDLDINSNVVFIGGPLFVQGNADIHAGTDFVPVPAGSKYPMFVRGSQSGIPSNVKVYSSCPKLELPWTDPDYNNAMLAKARAESSDNLRGTDHEDGSTPTNDEVATTGMPTTYVGPKAPGATNYYKEIAGNLTITGASASFGKVTKTAGIATNWDDFAYDTVDDTLYVDGVVFVDGDVTIGSGVRDYKGSGIIVATGNVLIATGGTFQPVGGDDEPDDLSSELCLEFVGQNISLDGGTFEGIIFANGDFDIYMGGALHGAVHANSINSMQPHTDLFMESNMSKAILPDGTPGSPSDPRGNNYGGGVVIPGTWSRLQ